MRAGLPFTDPPNVTVGADGVINLTAKVTRFDLSGRLVWGDSYNGSFVGPTIHLTPGTTTTIAFHNQLPVVSNLHFHGMHVSPSGSSDNVFLDISPHKTFTYHLAVPASQSLGTYYYHDHDMATSASIPGTQPTATSGSDIESEMYAGLAGTILVGDDRTLLPARLQGITAHTLALKDIQISATGRILQSTSNGGGPNSNDPSVRLINGQLQPVLTMKPSETQLWRLANEGADIYYRLQFSGSRFIVIAHDGVPVAKVTSSNTLLLAPGNRYDVLVTAPKQLGTEVLRTLSYQNGPGGDQYPTVKLMTVHIAGTAQSAIAMPGGAMPDAAANLRTAHVVRDRTLVLSEGQGVMFINGQTFNMNKSIFSTPGIVNTVEQWTIKNISNENHAFHLHISQFEVMSVNGIAQPYTSVSDVVVVPSGGQVVIRVKLADYVGKWMFHCHIAQHEVQGMMSFLNVVAAPATAARVAARLSG